MSLPATVENLLNHEVEGDSNIKSLKKKNVTTSYKEQENILQKLFFMGTFEEISDWVSINSCRQRYIAHPSNSGDADRLNCLFAIQKPIALAIKNVKKRRKNGRDKRLKNAAESHNYFVIADIIASTAWSYWKDHPIKYLYIKNNNEY